MSFFHCRCCSTWQTHRRLTTANPPIPKQYWNHGGGKKSDTRYTVSAIAVEPISGDTIVGSAYSDTRTFGLPAALLVARYSAANGKSLWSTEIFPQASAGFPWLEGLALNNDKTTVGFCASYGGAHGATVGALQVSDGTLAWSKSVGGFFPNIAGQTGSTVLWIGTSLILRSHDFMVRSFKDSDGTLQWTSGGNFSPGSQPQFAAIAYTSPNLYGWSFAPQGLWQIDKTTGDTTLIVTSAIGSEVLAMAAYSDGSLLSQRTSLLWRHQPNAALTTVWSVARPSLQWQFSIDSSSNLYGVDTQNLRRWNSAGTLDYTWASPDINALDSGYKAASLTINSATQEPYIGGSTMRKK